MASSNCVADVRKLATAALKSGHPQHGVTQPPSKWASVAGYNGSAASPLRQHMARSNGNGCGRQARYPAVNAEGMVGLLDLADRYQAEKAQAKRDAISKRIGTRLRPATASGARAAKSQAKVATRKAGAAKRAPAKAKAKEAAPEAPIAA